MNSRTNRFVSMSLFSVVTALATNARGQMITVTISADVIDVDPFTATIDDLPGPDGGVSFSEAMIAANNTPGHQTIGFNIPQSDWQYQNFFPGRAVLTSVVGYYFRAFDEVTIDGTTQTDFTGDTNPDGWEVMVWGHEVYLNDDNSTLIGFDSSNIVVTGSNGLVEGNTGSMNIELFGGSGSTVRGNTGGTIKIDRSSNNTVVGNTFARIRILGWVGGGQAAMDNQVGGPAPEDRNYFTGYGTWNSEGLPGGIAVQIFDSIGTRIENNSIGSTPDGMAKGNAACTIGIGFEGDNHDALILNNRIAGILGEGHPPHHAGQLFGRAIYMNGDGSDFTFFGNTIGLNANGDPLLGSVYGFDIGYFNFSGITNVQIGGAAPGEGNVIAGHLFNGITVQRDVPSVRISGNSIYGNADLAIDLVPSGFGYGHTPNDPLDTDTGGNGLQNYPVLATATREGAMLHIIGSLHSAPSNSYMIEFFASPECDDGGFGEGAQFLGAAPATTDGAGDAIIDVVIPAIVPAGWLVTATATLEPLGATSEFSACTIVTGDILVGDITGDGTVDVADLLALLAAWGPCPGCTADLDGNGQVDIGDLLLLLSNWT